MSCTLSLWTSRSVSNASCFLRRPWLKSRKSYVCFHQRILLYLKRFRKLKMISVNIPNSIKVTLAMERWNWGFGDMELVTHCNNLREWPPNNSFPMRNGSCPTPKTTFIESSQFIPIYKVYSVFDSVFIPLNTAAFSRFGVFPFLS